MDNLILEAIVAELRPLLIGHPVHRVAAPSPDTIAVLFDDPGRSRLLISASTALPRLHLTRAARTGRQGLPSGFGALASHHLAGAILVELEKDAHERVVRLRFAGASGPGKSLVAELLGRASNLVLIDPGERILGFLRRVKAEYRRPVVGQPYEPPRRGDRADPRDLTREIVDGLEERSRRESHPLADLLLEACPPLGPLAAREIEHRTMAGESAFAVLREWMERIFTVPKAPFVMASRSHAELSDQGDEDGTNEAGRTLEQPLGDPIGDGRGFIYSGTSPEALDRRRTIAPGGYLLSPLPLASAGPHLVRYSYPSLNEAAEVYFGSLASGLAFRTRRDALAAIAHREGKRAHEIAVKVARDLEGMKGAEKYRIAAEALLAGLTRAERKGDRVVVPDPYSTDETPMSIAIDPALSIHANADRYFNRFRKAERGREIAETRRIAQTRRSEVMSAIETRLAEAAADQDLDRAEEELRGEGIAVGLERGQRCGAPAPVEPRQAGVRIYKSSDGYEILVGKGSDENDRLSFKIASPEDFWLHASGASGAHVVVRNPRSEPRLPAATLREAAELAAFYSKAKETGRAEVIVTRRKFVRRVRGGPRGTVTVKKHETLRVVPRHPFE